MSNTKEKLQQAVQQVRASLVVDDDQKDAMCDVLLSGIKACADPANEPLGELVLYHIRGDLRLNDRMQRHIDDHAANCKGRGYAPDGKLGAIFAFRWPLAIVISVLSLSPYAGPAMERLIDAYGKKVAPHAESSIQR